MLVLVDYRLKNTQRYFWNAWNVLKRMRIRIKKNRACTLRGVVRVSQTATSAKLLSKVVSVELFTSTVALCKYGSHRIFKLGACWPKAGTCLVS